MKHENAGVKMKSYSENLILYPKFILSIRVLKYLKDGQ